MSVINHYSALPIQLPKTSEPTATLTATARPGWHGLVAMTPPQSLASQTTRLMRDVLRLIVRPIRWMAARLLGRQTARQIETLRVGQEDLTIALRELMAGRGSACDGPQQTGVRSRKLVWISSWQTRCGIAEYSRQLIEAIQATQAGWDITVLHDQRPTLPQVAAPAGVNARAGFALNGVNNVARLALGIAAERADCVVIQHHAAMIAWADLADLLLHPVVVSRRIVVALHNTQEILLLPVWLRERLFLALHGADLVVVHAKRDLELLYAWGLNNVQRIAHGCEPISQAVPLREMSPGSAPLLGCTGFLLPHKGARELIAAAAALRDVWPDLRLRLVMADHGSRKSAAEFRACQALARKLRFAEHLELHTEFLTPAQTRERLSQCDLLVLPYGKTLESASGAARIAVASSVPTLVTDQPIFDDLGDAVGRLNSVVPGGLAGQIEEWLLSTRRRDRLQRQAVAWCAAHEWHQVGRELAQALESRASAR